MDIVNTKIDHVPNFKIQILRRRVSTITPDAGLRKKCCKLMIKS